MGMQIGEAVIKKVRVFDKIIDRLNGFFVQTNFNNAFIIGLDENYVKKISTAFIVWIFNEPDSFSLLQDQFCIANDNEHAAIIEETNGGLEIDLSLSFIKYVIQKRIPFFQFAGYSYIEKTIKELNYNRNSGDELYIFISTKAGLAKFNITNAINDCLIRKGVEEYQSLILPKNAYTAGNINSNLFLFRTNSNYQYVIDHYGEIKKIINVSDLYNECIVYKDLHIKLRQYIGKTQSLCMLESIAFASLIYPKFKELLNTLTKVKSADENTFDTTFIRFDTTSIMSINDDDYTIRELIVNNIVLK
jgi:hypothetical protein